MITGLVLFYRVPFPEDQVSCVDRRARRTRWPASDISTGFAFLSTPYMAYAGGFSMVYTFYVETRQTGFGTPTHLSRPAQARKTISSARRGPRG
jgi:hypothetical protein